MIFLGLLVVGRSVSVLPTKILSLPQRMQYHNESKCLTQRTVVTGSALECVGVSLIHSWQPALFLPTLPEVVFSLGISPYFSVHLCIVLLISIYNSQLTYFWVFYLLVFFEIAMLRPVYLVFPVYGPHTFILFVIALALFICIFEMLYFCLKSFTKLVKLRHDCYRHHNHGRSGNGKIGEIKPAFNTLVID